MILISNPHCDLDFTQNDHWNYKTPAGFTLSFITPIFEVNGEITPTHISSWQLKENPRLLSKSCTQQTWVGEVCNAPGLTLALTVRTAPDSPFIRFRYTLSSEKDHHLTKIAGRDNLSYITLSPLSPANWSANEIQFARYNQMLHSYMLAENELRALDFEASQAVMGPILVRSDGKTSCLLAYEHGSQYPDAFVKFHLSPDGSVALRAERGNYWNGRSLRDPYTTLWLQIGAIDGPDDELARSYRHFVHQRFALHNASRQPYIFYNTWNYQERLRHWKGGSYLDEFHTDRIVAEIDAAHRMGVEVFVLDTGWYEKTGDWQASSQRFPEGLSTIRERLDHYGMHLGLWFNPTLAALSSQMAQSHTDCLKTKDGLPLPAGKVWLTEESRPHCLISRFGKDIADRLIALNRELGVTYFKWDGVDTYNWGVASPKGCDAADHGHGDKTVSLDERAECAAFMFPLAMVEIVERISEACPQAIIDFDITEAGRAVGLSFLSVGKYFLVNNGPYFHEYNIPLPPDQNWNMLFYPGPARAWFCRSALSYDKWIPSVLFLTHFFPDETVGKDADSNHPSLDSQLINIGSMILGGNGIWGDLPAVSSEGIDRISRWLSIYKQVRADITAATMHRFGLPATAPEIYEKLLLDPRTSVARGVVVLFSSFPGVTQHITSLPVCVNSIATDGIKVRRQTDGRAELEMTNTGQYTCGFVFFGAK